MDRDFEEMSKVAYPVDYDAKKEKAWKEGRLHKNTKHRLTNKELSKRKKHGNRR